MSELYAGTEAGVEEVSPPPELPEADDSGEPVAPIHGGELGDDAQETLERGDAEASLEEPDAPVEPEVLDETSEGTQAPTDVVEPLESAQPSAPEVVEQGEGTGEASEAEEPDEPLEPLEAEGDVWQSADTRDALEPDEAEDMEAFVEDSDVQASSEDENSTSDEGEVTPEGGAATSESGDPSAEGFSEVDAKISEFEKQGHGPQRHLHPTTEALKDRKGEPKTDENQDAIIKGNGHVKTINHVNPETGKTRELTEDGQTKSHYCGDYSTKFKNAEDYVCAEEYLREKMIETGDSKVSASIEDIFGPGDHSDRFEGYYVDPINPTAMDGSVNHLPVNFEDGYVNAVYDRETDGLKTMYPNPEQGRHP